MYLTHQTMDDWMTSNTDTAHFKGTQLVVGAHEDTETYDARFLISTLLVYVAKSDGRISDLESNTMLDMLISRMNIRGAEALERLSTAIMELSNDKDIAQTLQELGQSLSDDEKDEIFAMILDLVLVDEILDDGEVEAVKMAGQILGLPQNTIHSRLREASGEN
jgi:uncharacterized tellurite resistance protein B-like protein